MCPCLFALCPHFPYLGNRQNQPSHRVMAKKICAYPKSFPALLKSAVCRQNKQLSKNNDDKNFFGNYDLIFQLQTSVVSMKRVTLESKTFWPIRSVSIFAELAHATVVAVAADLVSA